MKNINFTLPGTLATLFIVSMLLTSCEKVIDLKLDNVEKKYVIEAMITDEPGHSRVILSRTKDFNEDNSIDYVSGAVVTITEQNGATTVFPQTAPGTYELADYVGTPGRNYFLNVTINGQTFSAGSAMPQKVNLDSIYITDEFLFTDTRKIANVEFKDPDGRGNNYRFVQYVNGFKEKQLQIQNDDYTDGNNVTNRLFFFSDEEDSGFIDSGDEVSIEMQCIDAAMYRYWFSLFRSALGTSGQATPANPVSNLQGGALGYFSAHTYQRKTIIAP
jgi:uncharacterized protein DUF4249